MSSSSGLVSSPGVGSGLNVNALVTSLMQPAQDKLTLLKSQQQSYQTTLSAFGALKSALSSFQASLSSLSDPSQFLQLSADSSDKTVVTATAASGAQAGNFSVNVSQLAQAQSLSAAGVASTTSAIGSGTPTKLTIDFGTISGGTLSNGTYSGASFTQNAAQQSLSVTIDSSNNTLQGIANAINAANGGVQATIVNDGSSTPYRLVLTSTATGQNMSMRISASNATGSGSPDSAIAGLLSYDPTGTQDMTQTAAAQNAQLTVNGLAVSSSTNTVSGAIQGVSLNLLKAGTATVTTANNTAGVTSAVNGFVSAYNTLNSAISSLTAYDSTGQNTGALLGDPTVQLIQNQIRSVLDNPLPGVGQSALSTLTQVGVQFQADGSLSVDSTKLQNAVNNNFSQLASLFATNGTATDSLVSYLGSSASTQAGQYAVNVTQAATQGSATGSVTLGASTVIDSTNNTLNLTLDNVSSSVTIPAGTYTASALASAIQSAINGNTTFANAGSTVAVTQSGGVLKFTSNRYGSASNVSFTGGNGYTALIGTTTNTTGLDIAGTIGGYATTGSGQTLTGAPGTAVAGLQISVQGTTTGNRGTLNFSQGYASLLSSQITGFLGNSGALTSATNSLNQTITSLTKAQTDWQAQMTQMQNTYLAQFTALDATISQLNSTSNYLQQVLGTSTGSSSGSSGSSGSSSGSSTKG
ncbi:flagellar filament capping protein FliD [Pandoraea sp.]|uniref:flagellar filament capping protein FliD n=1 Tax=Pandoraea sp. TaxID=1883445 RepID=UPI001200AD5A|nr:flagellar filament capping protein FliD [Pandoraea sp.]TAL52632.1 MAG: flagellar hook protein FliD [Pandoraea sp.]TAM14286.1 MAG: flagellar hook protein FliD [Pandoraea sp.]